MPWTIPIKLQYKVKVYGNHWYSYENTVGIYSSIWKLRFHMYQMLTFLVTSEKSLSCSELLAYCTEKNSMRFSRMFRIIFELYYYILIYNKLSVQIINREPQI